MSLAAFRGTSRALRTLPRWAAVATTVRVQSGARRLQSSSATSLEGQQSVRRASTSASADIGNTTHGADTDAGQKLLSAHLRTADPAVYDIIEKEKNRQKHSINLIPSENFTSQAVLDALGSVMQSGILFQCKMRTMGNANVATRQIF